MESYKTFELERKFLLKQLPQLLYDKKLQIEQYYLQSDDQCAKRVRKTVCEDTTTYHYTEKIFNDDKTEEIEKEISIEEFNNLKESTLTVIKKTRYICSDGNRNWEIDKFDNIPLIIAEIEFIANDTNFNSIHKRLSNYKIPEFIKNNLVLEVSDMKEFSNKELALSI